MDPFEYVCVLTSIVAGLAVTRLVGGIGQLLQTRKRTPGYWVHALWMANTLMSVIITWWIQYRWRTTGQWTLFLVLWLLVAPINLYLAAALLFPNEAEGDPILNWRDHFFEHRRGFFVLMGMNFAIDLLDTLLKGWQHFVSLGPLYAGSMTMFLTLCLVAAFTKSTRFHAAFAVFYFLYNGVMLGSNLLRLT
ncbi:MAG TPA: hypothetical protein VJS88_05730 [Chthoniobacterales bacterium]|nr:hypothetical protein [Chthoniobacterales bacterium]